MKGFVTLTDAARFSGIDRRVLERMLRLGHLQEYRLKLDRRGRFVKIEDVLALRTPVPAASGRQERRSQTVA